MSAGLAALLDDVAALARAAAASIDDIAAGAGRASVKAAGVIVDDAAVTPRYVQGFQPERELPMIKRIAIGSLRNKLLFILPAALLLSELLPWLLTPILMIGGAYLCFEGAEKVWEDRPAPPRARGAGRASGTRARGRARQRRDPHGLDPVRGDHGDLARRGRRRAVALAALILVVVAFAITARVYGVVALIVKMDDVGLRLAQTARARPRRSGEGWSAAMPIVMSVLSTVGIAAMLWVGGHILLVGLDELGLSGPYDAVHHLEEDVHDALGAVGGVGAWLTNTAASAVLGPRRRRGRRGGHAPPPLKARAHLGQRHRVGAGRVAEPSGRVVARVPDRLGDVGRGHRARLPEGREDGCANGA